MVGPSYLFSMMWWSLLSNLVEIEDFLRKIQRIPCGAGMVRGPSGFLSYPTSLSHTLAVGDFRQTAPVGP